MKNWIFSSVSVFSLRNISMLLIATGLLGFANATYATPLPVGSAILAAAGAGPVGGTVVANSGPIAFASATFTGTLTSEVIANDPANPFGPGFYTFTYLLTNVGGPNAIDRITVPGYGIAGLSIDAAYQAPTIGVIPTSFDRSSAATAGNVVGTSFTPAPLGVGVLSPGATSALLVIQTNTNEFDNSSASIIDGSTAQVATFAPLPFNPVPEPSTLILGALGLAGMGLGFRRKFAV